MRSRQLPTLFVILTLILGLFCGSTARAADLVKVSTAWMDEHETFLMWYAKQKGWDKEAGLDIELGFFNSGKDIMKARETSAWAFAGVSSVAGMLGALDNDISVIAVANDASLTNAVLVRKNSYIPDHKGENPLYPDVMGTPVLMKGKTFVTTTMSSAHYALGTWLEALGLKLSDVVVKDMNQSQALVAFENNLGDGVALRSPHLYVGADQGWVIVSSLKKCDAAAPTLLVADSKYAEANPEVTAKFLAIYLRAVDTIQTTDPEELAADYQRFFLQWAGKNYSKSLALYDLKSHPVFDLKDQLAMFDTSKGQSQIQAWETKIAEFFARNGLISDDQLKKASAGAYITDRYLKMVAESAAK
ncbi:MAG: ABC transporter substrate-binding protein [Desulfovibrionaceae bacterium]|nr:ABC transporter substrate-binding protein [Desulfovibrionaceae bacterium]